MNGMVLGKEKLKRISGAVMVASILLQYSSPVFASENLNINEDVNIIALSENTVTVSDGEDSYIVSVEENDSYKLVTIKNSRSDKTEFIREDKINNKVYSSITGETIDLNSNSGFEASPESVLTIKERSDTSYETKYISYASIKRIVGNAASKGAVIGAILFFIPWAQQIGGAIGSISTIVAYLNSHVSPSSNHGIKLKIKVTKHYRTRLGKRRLYKTDRSIVSASTY